MNLQICAAITGRSMREVEHMVKLAEDNEADLLEIRMDYLLGKMDLQAIRKLTSKPLVATNRPANEGGLSSLSEDERMKTLYLAVKAGFEYADIELSNRHASEVAGTVRREGGSPIISIHNFNSTPSMNVLMRLLNRELETGAEICKIVSTARKIEDNFTCLNFVDKVSKRVKIVSFCMGDYGVLSRVLSPFFGGSFTFASVEHGKESASGQITVREMRSIYRLMRIENRLENETLLLNRKPS